MPKFTHEELKKYLPHRYEKPKINRTVLVAKGACVVGDVVIGEYSSIWFNTIVRADVNYVRIGEKTNIQDLSVVHESYLAEPTIIGNSVTVGHSVVLHACTVRDFALIGMGSVVLDGAEIGEGALIGAGSLVTQNTKIPPFTKAFGRPCKVIADLTEKEIDDIKRSADHYVKLAKTYMAR